MPVLKKIVVQDFRNIALQELVFSPNINCISGNNGEGKTNLIDAIYYLSMTKSAFGSSDRFNFRYGTGAFTIAGSYLMPGGLESRFSIAVTSDGEKKVKRDDKPCKRISEHIGVLPIVLVSPSDISMVSDSGEERRKFVNAVLSQMDRNYLDNVQQYNRYLLQRNRLLKGGELDEVLMDTFDARLSALAAPIVASRRELAESLAPVVQAYYTELSGGREEVGIEYRTDADRGPLDAQLRACRDRDRALKYTSVGVQRDDFLFTMNGYPIRKCGSQGQQKSFLVSLKFAQYEIMRESYGFAPILLLDDLFDKLDMNRVSNLLSMVAGSDFGQIFLTDSNKVRLARIVDALTEDRSYFETEDGVFTRVEE
jgi:DNA replication and repair protein RecF